MRNITLLIPFFLTFFVNAASIPVISTPYNDMKPYIASYNINSPTFDLAWERGDTTSSCTIFVSINDSNLIDISPMQLTNGNYVDKNPIITYVDSLTPMVIWERKSGTYFQLYSSYYQGNNTWSTPEAIYSILGDECYPFASGRELYFSSINRIYYSHFNGVSWGEASIISNINDSCYHPSYSPVTGPVYDVLLNGVWQIHQSDSLFTNSSLEPFFPIVTDSGDYLYVRKIGAVKSLILFHGNEEYVLDTSNIFIGHHAIAGIGSVINGNAGDMECYIKNDTAFAFNSISNQRYILNSGNYIDDFPSLCIINGYRTQYRVPIVFQEYHDGKWQIYGDILYLTNGGIGENPLAHRNDRIVIHYLSDGIEIYTDSPASLYGIDGTFIKKIIRGNSQLKFSNLKRGIYFIILQTGQTKKINIQ